MEANQIRLKILKILYRQSMRCASYVKIDFVAEEMEKIDDEEVLFHIHYLKEKGYVNLDHINDGFVTTKKCMITDSGIDLIKKADD
ncbi:hypothetical protein [Methanobacterium sp.]|uniref:hypothetical protein n=1 Tax=Methanobacterium sp. TaxID=2164 RepID=UPI003C718F7F